MGLRTFDRDNLEWPTRQPRLTSSDSIATFSTAFGSLCQMVLARTSLDLHDSKSRQRSQ